MSARIVLVIFASAVVLGANAKAPADVSVPPVVMESTPSPTVLKPLEPAVVRGVVTCPEADRSKVAAIESYVGPVSPDEILRAVGCR